MATIANPAQSAIEATLGPMVMGILCSIFLMGIICTQAGRYFMRFGSRDSTLILALVTILLLLNLFEMGSDCHILYRTAIRHYGDYQYVDLQALTMFAEPGITAAIGFFAHLYFADRYVRAINRPLYIVFPFSLLLLLSLASGLAVSVSFGKVKLVSELAKIPIPISCWLISTAATDLCLATILGIALWRAAPSRSRTQSVTLRLFFMSMETCAVTAIVAIANVIIYFAMKTTYYSLLPQFLLCRLYTITVLVTLLVREDLRREFDGQASSYYDNSYTSFGFRRTMKERTASQAVEVKMTTIVERDHIPVGSITGREDDSKPRRSESQKVSIWSPAV